MTFNHIRQGQNGLLDLVIILCALVLPILHLFTLALTSKILESQMDKANTGRLVYGVQSIAHNMDMIATNETPEIDHELPIYFKHFALVLLPPNMGPVSSDFTSFILRLTTSVIRYVKERCRDNKCSVPSRYTRA